MPDAPSCGEGWIPIARGALDVRGSDTFLPEAAILLVPAQPGPALCLTGDGARLWQRLVDMAPASPADFSSAENDLLDTLRDAGLVTFALDHPAAIKRVPTPVLSSPLHELTYALVQGVAESAGISCIFVKGPALHHQGLREREHSGDVDVWCEPSRWEDLATALEPWGWVRELDPWRGSSIHHSTTMLPLSWGCEVDIHRRFPGLTLDDPRAFDAISKHSAPVVYAGVEIAVPGRDAHAVIAALHAVRPAVGHRVGEHEHRTARDLLAGAAGSLDAAHELGAVAALRLDLAATFPGVDLGPDEGTPRDWWHRAQPDRARAYMSALRTLPLLERIRAAYALLWPADDIALASARRAGEATSHAGRARRRRLIRGIRSLLNGRRRRER